MRLNPIGANRTEMHLDSGAVVFFSYKTPVAALLADGGGYVRTATRYSVTTSKHVNQWLDGVTAREVPQAEIDALTGEGAR